MLESSPIEYANKILTKIRELSKLVHDLRNEDKAFIDSLDIDAQLIRKGKRIAFGSFKEKDWLAGQRYIGSSFPRCGYHRTPGTSFML
jgi:hypothetical protein